MNEEIDEADKELKPHVSEEVKVETSVISPAIGLHDVTVLHHDSDSGGRVSQENNGNESLDPVDARHLNSVYQYTSRIRQFIGLIDSEKIEPVPVSSPENVTANDESDEGSYLVKNDVIKGKTDTELNENEVDSKTIEGIEPEFNISSLIKNDSDIQESIEPLNGNDKELLLLSTDNETEKPFISDDTNENNQRGGNETEKLQISEYDNEKLIKIGKTENPANDIIGDDGITSIECVSPNDDEKRDLIETTEDDLAYAAISTQLNTEPENISSEQNEKDTIMPVDLLDDKIKSPLLKSDAEDTTNNGVDLNEPGIILKDEEEKAENQLDKKVSSDSGISATKNEEQIETKLDNTENLKNFEKPNTLFNEKEQNESFTENSNSTEGNDTNNLPSELYAISEEQDGIISTDEIQHTPQFKNIRRLSVEIVNKVLDTAEIQLKDILKEKRKSNADASNLLECSSDLQNISPLPGEAVKALHSESDNVSHVEGKKDTKLSEQHDVKQKQNNEIQLKEVLAKTYDSNDFQKKIEVEMNKVDPRYDVDPDIVCGIGFFKPRWIQPYATSRVYLILYSIIGILSGSYYSYLIGAMSTLEKRFAFKSKTSGYVMMLDEITPLLLGVFIGYFGGKSHRPRMVGLGMLMSSVACFVSALPYFIYGPATHLSLGYSTVDNEKKLELCNEDPREEFCDNEDRLPTLTPILLLMLGSFMKGFGNLAYYAIGLAYMDDNAKKKNTPMYFAVAFSLRLLGPMVGFLMSSFFLKYYENPFVDPGFGTSDPRWIGCWWLGFIVQGILLSIFTIPISLFPRRLPDTVDYSKPEEDPHLVTSFVGLFSALKRLSKNPVFCLIVLNAIFGIFGSFGHYINLPRYMENQFRLSASSSSLISGPPSIAAVMISMTTGGYLIWKFKPGAKFLAGALCAAELLQTCTYLILMIPTCQRVDITSYGFSDEGLILQSECNNNCNCTTSAFSPVCGPDGATMFFSPCHAGCTEKVNGTYAHCSCVFDSSGQQRDYVTDGFCITEDCLPGILAYILTMPVVQLVVNLAKVGQTMIFLRSIKPEDKSVALGTFETIICAFGFIPYPIVYGALVDSACLIWESSCGDTGNCWYYNVPKLNYLLHGTSALFSTFDALTLLGIFFLGSRVHDLYREDYETEGNTGTEKTEGEAQKHGKDSTSTTKL